jgi:hypothetical protein
MKLFLRTTTSDQLYRQKMWSPNPDSQGNYLLWSEVECVTANYQPCHTANEGPVRIQYKCLVVIYVFLEIKLLQYFSKTEL